MKGFDSVDEYIAASEWSSELTKLREILTSTDLEETVKWGAPCYTISGKNVVGIAGFKNYFGLWFHQGALLRDESGVLINAQEGKTKALRQWRFDSARAVKVRLIKAYVNEAIELARQGKEIKADRSKVLVIPPELERALAGEPKLARAFAALSKGKQREYADHVQDAKRAETKEKRLAKIVPMIEAGVGLHDKYRNC